MNVDKIEKAFMTFCFFFCFTSLLLIYANAQHNKVMNEEEDLLKYHLDDKELDRCYYYAMSEKKNF